MDADAIAGQRWRARREHRVVGFLVRHQAQGDAAVAGVAAGVRACGVLAGGDPVGVAAAFEKDLAVVADGNEGAAGDLYLSLAFVAVVGVGTVRVANERLGIALAAGEQVLAAGVAAVEQVQQFVLALRQFGGQRVLVRGVEAAVAGLHGDLADTMDDRADRIEDGLLLLQAVLRCRDARLVLTVERLLLVQLKQPDGADRVVGRGQQALAGTDFGLGARQVGIVAGDATDRVVESLDR